MNTEIAVASNVALMGGADFSEVVQERSKTLDRRSLVIADSGIKDVEVLLGHLDPGTDLLSVDSSADFGTLLKEALNGGYVRLHFLGHGQSGEIRFGDRALQVEDFTAVSPNEGNVKIPSLHFWSCMTGAGVKGRAFVEGIAKAFGAAVTAFSDLVGAKGLGGSWSPDVCSHEAGFVGAPFANALAYKYTLQTSVLNLIAVPTATGEDVQVWLKGGIAIDAADLVLSYDTTKASYTGAAGNSVLGWSWVPNQDAPGHLLIGGFSSTAETINSLSDILLETISFTLASGSTGSSVSVETGTDLSNSNNSPNSVPLGTLPELKPPTVLTFNPVDASTNVPVVSNIVVTFTEAIQKGTGLIEIHSGSASGTVVESYDAATSTNLTISGSALTINPTANLANETNYFVTFAAGSIKDLAGNNYSGTTTYDFTTAPRTNDSPPILSIDNASSVSLAENAVAGAIAGAVAHATDADGDSVIFSLLNAPSINGNALFSIDSAKGQISLTAAGAAAIDYESSTKSYPLTVKASDGLTAHDQTATVTVNLTNVNDNAPVFTSGGTGSVAENAATSTVIYTAATTDADNLAARTYTLGGTDAALLNIDASTGAVTLKASANYEVKPSYSFNVLANDGANTTPQAVVVSVTNVNDNAPVFTSGGTGSVAENAATSTVIYTAATTDADNLAARTYTLGGTDAALLNIDASTGAVTLKASANYEVKPSYSFDVLANDGANTTSQTVVVSVTNVNDNAPVFTSGGTGSVAENAAISTVIYTAVTTDADNLSARTYTLEGTDAALLSINASTGAVTLKASANYEVKPSYSFNVLANDGANTTPQAVVVSVTNVNDAPTGSVTITGTATEHEILTAHNTLVDEDGIIGNITYQWQSSSNGTDWNNINGATSNTYTLTEAETGKNLKVVASYTDGLGTAEHVASTATGAVANVNDAPTGNVTISGSATQGQQLTVSNTLADADGLGTISYQWQAGGSDIIGATSSTYTLTQEEVGKTVTVVASYTDGHGTAEHVSSTATGIIANVNDAPTGAVVITGTASRGATLTADITTLADADGLGTIHYQWKADNTDIANATGKTWLLTAGEVGKTVTVVASYIDNYGAHESVISAATNAVAEHQNNLPTGSVTIAGTATQGQQLTASNTLADADGLGTISYQWQAAGSAISGATSNTYTLTEAEVGKTVTVVASYTDGFGVVESKASGATSAVVNVNDAPTGSVTIAGTATQGQQLTVSNTLADADGLGTISYQWKAGGSDISGATSITYTLTEAEVGKTVTVVASYTDGHGTVEHVTSEATSAVANVNDAPTGSVTIAGTATQGQQLTASNTLADLDGLGTISYQWQAGGSDISGATSSTYTLREAEVGKTVTVVASYTDGHGTLEHFTSTATGAVANVNDAPTGSVTITGTATQGQQLTVSNTLADADGLGTISYQWQAGGSDISGATSSTYTLTEAEVGKTVTVVASYTDGHSTAEHVTSTTTGAIVNVNDAPTGNVTIDGTATQGQTLTADSSTLADSDGLGAISYQWLADGVNITGATGSTLLLGAGQRGKVITVDASYTDGHGTAEHVSSTATETVVGTQSGIVQDGYLSHALVWVDANNDSQLNWNDTNSNGKWDVGEGESWTLTDGSGQFTGLVGDGTVRITANPHGSATNPGNIDTVDISTNKPFTGNYSAPSGSTVVNPLTTLVVAAIAAGGDASSVKTALGLDANLNLSTYDALAEAAKQGLSSADVAMAIKVQSAAIQIANIMDIATGVAEGSGASASDIVKVAADVASSLIGGTPGTTINLADSAVISAAINSALTNVTTAPTADTVTALAATAAFVNDTIVAAAGQTGGATALASLTKMVQAQIVAQDVAQTMQESHSFVALTSDQVNTQIAAESSNVKDIFTNHTPTGDVTMTGTPTQGETLTAHNTLADVDGPGTISYQWKSDGVNIGGATSDTLILGEAQVNHQVSVVASYTDGASHAESVSSIATAVANINDVPTGGVTISSTDHTLTANTTTLKDADGLGTLSYQWQSGGVNIEGATGSSVTFTSSDIGKTFTVTASYTDGHGTHEHVDSSAFVAADPYAGGHDGGGISTGAVLAGVGGLGLLAWVLF